MRIENLQQNIQFQKKLIANANVIKNNLPYECQIFELEKGIDKDYFAKQGQIWKKASYLDSIIEELQPQKHTFIENSQIYVIEDKKGRCLGYCQQDTSDSENEVAIIEVRPDLRYENEKRKIKYVGETLIAFLTKLSARQKKSSLKINRPAKNANDFYIEKCGFKNDGKSPKLKKTGFNALIKQNEKRTKGTIDFVDRT